MDSLLGCILHLCEVSPVLQGLPYQQPTTAVINKQLQAMDPGLDWKINIVRFGIRPSAKTNILYFIFQGIV